MGLEDNLALAAQRAIGTGQAQMLLINHTFVVHYLALIPFSLIGDETEMRIVSYSILGRCDVKLERN